jgi:hypothetical protein
MIMTMNKVVYAIAAIVTIVAFSGIASMLVAMSQQVAAVCSSDGRCTGTGGTNGTAGSITPCVNGHRNVTSSDGRTLTQKC